jgi:hypothetical protein
MNINITFDNEKPSMNTSQRIRHVYGCKGPVQHILTGIELLRAGEKRCPRPGCGAEVEDITETEQGKAYFAFARPDQEGRPA